MTTKKSAKKVSKRTNLRKATKLEQKKPLSAGDLSKALAD